MVRRIIFLNGIAGRLHHCQIRNHPRTMFLPGLKLHQKKYGRSSRSVEAMRAGVSGPTDCDPRQRVLTTRKNLTDVGKRPPAARILSYGFASFLTDSRRKASWWEFVAPGRPCPQTSGAKSTSGERSFSRAHRRETSPLRRAPGAAGPGGRSLS